MSTTQQTNMDENLGEKERFDKAYSLGYTDGCIEERGRSVGKLDMKILADRIGYFRGYSDAIRDSYLG